MNYDGGIGVDAAAAVGLSVTNILCMYVALYVIASCFWGIKLSSGVTYIHLGKSYDASAAHSSLQLLQLLTGL